MLHDLELLDELSQLPKESFDGESFRATRRSLDALAPSTSGGRWSPKGGPAVLYTSLSKEGALAEISFHWGLLVPPKTCQMASMEREPCKFYGMISVSLKKGDILLFLVISVSSKTCFMAPTPSHAEAAPPG